MPTITIQDFLTAQQIQECIIIYKSQETEGIKSLAQRICDKVITPNIVSINRKLQQENDPMFLAYAVEYVLNQSRRKI